MQILRWLLVHPIIFGWVLVVLAILLNYGVGSKAPEHADAAADVHQSEGSAAQQVVGTEASAEAGQEAATGTEADTPAAEVTADAASAQPLMAKPEGDAGAAAVEQAAEAVSEAVNVAENKVEQVTETVVATGTVVAAVGTAEEATASAGTEAAPADAVAAEQAAGSEAAPADAGQAAAVTAGTESTTPAEAPAVLETPQGTVVEATSSDADLLQAAREAYWSNDFERASGFYTELLAQNDQPDYKGELANVYWKQGKSNEAVALYLETAGWLKAQGRMTELQNIKLYVEMVDPAKAAEIEAIMQQP